MAIKYPNPKRWSKHSGRDRRPSFPTTGDFEDPPRGYATLAADPEPEGRFVDKVTGKLRIPESAISDSLRQEREDTAALLGIDPYKGPGAIKPPKAERYDGLSLMGAELEQAAKVLEHRKASQAKEAGGRE